MSHNKAVLTDEQILAAIKPELDNADGGYICDVFPEHAILAGRAIEAAVLASADNPSTAGAAKPYAYEESDGRTSELIYAQWFDAGCGQMDENKTYTALYLAAPVAQSTAGAGPILDRLWQRVKEAKDAAYTFGDFSKEAVEIALDGVLDLITEAGKAIAAPALNPSEVPANSNSVEFEGIKTAAPLQPEVPLWDENGEPWNLAAEQVEYERAQAASKEGGAA